MPADRQTDLLNRARRHPGPIRDGDRLVAIAQAHGEVLGALVLLDPLNAAGEHARLALEDGATMLALELVHQQNLAEVELRLRRDLIDDLLGGTADASVFARARSLGHDLNLPHRVIVVSCNKQSDELVLQAVQRATSTLSMGCLLTHKPGLVVLLVRNPGAWDGQRPWDRLHTAIKREMRSAQGAVGVGGNASDPSDLARSYQEAQQALAIRQRSRDPDGVTVFEDLGIYRLLSSDAPFEEADRFVKEWLGSLVDYDERHNSELVRTLSLYLEHGGNYDCTASALQIHRSTLRYRLQRIRDISCRDLTDPHNRLNLHLATQAWHILQGTA
jgi:sugar diacid utilization regulator